MLKLVEVQPAVVNVQVAVAVAPPVNVAVATTPPNSFPFWLSRGLPNETVYVGVVAASLTENTVEAVATPESAVNTSNRTVDLTVTITIVSTA
jgi:hypothetical protein